MKKSQNFYESFLLIRMGSPLLKRMAVLLLCLSLVTITNAAGLSKKVNLNMTGNTIKEVLREIEKQSDYTFVYNDASINVNQVVSVQTEEYEEVTEVLDDVFAETDINYTVVDNQIVLTEEAESANASLQERIDISGTVTEAATGDPLPGVSILEKGTTTGTITDLDGKFSMSVSPDATIIVSFVGFVSQEVEVSSQTEFNIALETELIGLDELVVIGYGTVKKSDLTGAVASVSAEELSQSAVSGIDQALQGRTAGVNVTSNTGTPGAAPTIRVRGIGTINNADPFFVVDGMPVSAEAVGALNPGDIESMEILKDASAAAIYGARAANGVILITTKKGKAGTSSISFDAYYGWQSPTKKYDILSAKEYIGIRNSIGDPPYAWEDSSQVPQTDWQDEIFRTAPTSNYQLSFLGGSEKIRYAIIGSYYKQDGIIKGSDYERYTLRVNTSSDVKDWLTVGENLSISFNEQNIIPEQNEWTSVVIQSLIMDPATPVYDSIGNPMGAIRNNIGNPVGQIERNHNVLNSNKILGNAYAELKPVKWFSYKFTIGTELTNTKNEQFFPVFEESAALNRTTNALIKGDYSTNTLLMENLFTFNHTIEKNSIQVIAGYTRQKTTFRRSFAIASNVPETENLWFLANGDAEGRTYSDVEDPLIPDFLPISPIPTDASMVSYLARAIYSYDNKYDLTASIRRDGSSKFGGNSRWGNFPSFAAGWKISSEQFMQSVPVISFLKLRAGWGKLGNQEIGDYVPFTSVRYGFNYTVGSYPNQTTIAGGAPISFANEDLAWEETEQTNIGLDINLLENRFSANFDYYIRKTNGMIIQKPIPKFTGIQENPWVNEGKVENKGWDLNLNWKETINDFTYSIGVNFASVKNEVLSVGGEDLYVPGGEFRASDFITRTEAGHPIASYYGYVSDGYWQTQEEIDEANERAVAAGHRQFDRRNTSPGDVKFVDINGDNRISGADKTYIGDPHPKLTYGIYVDLAYKFVDLKLFGQGVRGNDIFMATNYYLESPVGYWNMSTTMLDYWQEQDDNTAVPRLDPDDENNNLRLSDRYIRDGSYFRIKNVQLGFTLPNNISQRFGVEKLRLYVAGQNLFTFHDYKGFDPEIGTGNDGATSSRTLDIGIDRGMYPVAKMFSLGVNLTF